MVVFTSIDGALRQHGSGSCTDARAAVDLLTGHGVPVVLVGRGRPEEAMALQRELGLKHPFISGNGEALHVPRGYFPELDEVRGGDDEWHILHFADGDPRRALRLAVSLYQMEQDDELTVGLGADWDDRILLGAVDVPVIVRCDSMDQSRLRRRIPNAYLTNAAGPAGWAEAILGSVAA
jgi:predicted mannosyl-3-phosphoglycerate phosphatase (HAD superfamily)